MVTLCKVHCSGVQQPWEYQQDKLKKVSVEVKKIKTNTSQEKYVTERPAPGGQNVIIKTPDAPKT